MRKKHVLDNLIIMLVLGLLIFHTFTFFQNFYNYFTTLAVFVVVFILSIIKTRGYVKISKKNSVLFLCIMIFVLSIIGIFFKDMDLTYMVGAYLPYAIWPILYAITEPLLTQKKKRSFLLTFALFLTVSVVASLSVLITDNDAARLLAGTAKDAVRYEYYSRGVGGYGFVYGCVFLIFGLSIWADKEKREPIRVLLWILITLMLVMILFSSYTIAVLFALIILVLSVYSRSKRKEATAILVIFLLMAFLLMGPILTVMHNVAQRIGLDWIVKRTAQLIDAQKTGAFEELSRIKLYRESIDIFIKNIWFGGTHTGGHSMMLDHLAQYGLLGGLFSFSFFRVLHKLGEKKGKRIRAIYWVFIGLLCINTADTIVMLPMVLFVLPMMISYDRNEEVKNEDRYCNTLLPK